MEKIKVILAEDHKMFRDLLSQELADNNFEIVGLAQNGKALLEILKNTIPDIVLLDLKMPILDGHEVLKILSQDFPELKTIVLSSDYSDLFVCSVILNGAAAYIKKDSAVSEVINAIEKVHRDGFYFNELVSREILEQLKSTHKIYYLMDNEKFTRREMEVLKALCEGGQQKDVARNLGISTNTLNFHTKNLKQKSELNNLKLLVKYAINQGIDEIRL